MQMRGIRKRAWGNVAFLSTGSKASLECLDANDPNRIGRDNSSIGALTDFSETLTPVQIIPVAMVALLSQHVLKVVIVRPQQFDRQVLGINFQERDFEWGVVAP